MIPSASIALVCPYCGIAILRAAATPVGGVLGMLRRMHEPVLMTLGAVIAVALVLVLQSSATGWPQLLLFVSGTTAAVLLLKTPRASREAREADFIALAAAGVIDSSTELELRLNAFWAANDILRGGNDQATQKPPSITPARAENLERLLGLLVTKLDGERLLAAEVLRHLGRFDSALELLGTEFEDPRHQRIVEFITKLAGENDRTAHPLPEGWEPQASEKEIR